MGKLKARKYSWCSQLRSNELAIIDFWGFHTVLCCCIATAYEMGKILREVAYLTGFIPKRAAAVLCLSSFTAPWLTHCHLRATPLALDSFIIDSGPIPMATSPVRNISFQ